MRDLGLDLRLDDNHLFLTTFEDLRTKSVSNLWKGAITPSAPGGKMDTRGLLLFS